MRTMSADKEIERLEREIEAKAGGSGRSSGSGDSEPLVSTKKGKPVKKGGDKSVLLVIGILVFFSV